MSANATFMLNDRYSWSFLAPEDGTVPHSNCKLDCMLHETLCKQGDNSPFLLVLYSFRAEVTLYKGHASPSWQVRHLSQAKMITMCTCDGYFLSMMSCYSGFGDSYHDLF